METLNPKPNDEMKNNKNLHSPSSPTTNLFERCTIESISFVLGVIFYYGGLQN
jgi:hypothetical protein